MVQIIPENPSFGAQFARNLGASANRTLSGINEEKSQMRQLQQQAALQQQSKQADIAQKLQAFEAFKKTPGYEKLNDFQKFVLEQEVAGRLSGGTSKSLINSQREQDSFSRLADLTQPLEQESSRMPSEEETLGQGKIPSETSEVKSVGNKTIPRSKLESMPESKLRAGLADKQLGPVFESELKRRQEEKDFNFKQSQEKQKQTEFSHKETSKYAEGLSSQASEALQVKHAIGDLRTALKNKASGAKARNLAFKYLNSKGNPLAGLFQTKDTQAIVTAQKALSGGFKTLFGSKPTEREFFWYENILPDLLKSTEVNESLANYYEDVADIQLKAQKIYDSIVKENGGYRPIDIDVRVREQLKPLTDKLISAGEKLSGYKLMRAPDGSIRQVPLQMVDDALGAGGELVE